jgi:hypothetical protein
VNTIKNIAITLCLATPQFVFCSSSPDGSKAPVSKRPLVAGGFLFSTQLTAEALTAGNPFLQLLSLLRCRLELSLPEGAPLFSAVGRKEKWKKLASFNDKSILAIAAFAATICKFPAASYHFEEFYFLRFPTVFNAPLLRFFKSAHYASPVLSDATHLGVALEMGPEEAIATKQIWAYLHRVRDKKGDFTPFYELYASTIYDIGDSNDMALGKLREYLIAIGQISERHRLLISDLVTAEFGEKTSDPSDPNRIIVFDPNEKWQCVRVEAVIDLPKSPERGAAEPGGGAASGPGAEAAASE